jgi:hypothetical protein
MKGEKKWRGEIEKEKKLKNYLRLKKQNQKNEYQI